MKMKRIVLSLPEDMWERASEIAWGKRKSLNGFIRDAVRVQLTPGLIPLHGGIIGVMKEEWKPFMVDKNVNDLSRTKLPPEEEEVWDKTDEFGEPIQKTTPVTPRRSTRKKDDALPKVLERKVK